MISNKNLVIHLLLAILPIGCFFPVAVMLQKRQLNKVMLFKLMRPLEGLK